MEQLLERSELPELLPRVQAGAERGLGWHELTAEILVKLAADRDENVRSSAETKLTRRKGKLTPSFASPLQGKQI